MDQLMFNSSHYMDILDTVTFYIVPILNLDGYNTTYGYTVKFNPPHDPFARGVLLLEYELFKNSRGGPRPPSCTGLPCRPGINIATNFPYKWDALPAKVIREFAPAKTGPPQGYEKYVFDFKDTRSIHYRGAGPCSESECQAVVNFIKAHKEIDTYVTLQGFANVSLTSRLTFPNFAYYKACWLLF